MEMKSANTGKVAFVIGKSCAYDWENDVYNEDDFTSVNGKANDL